MGQYCHKVLFFISTMKISLDFSAQYCTVRLLLFLQEKMNYQILKDKNPGEKREFAEKNAIVLLQIPSFLLIHGVSCSDNDTTEFQVEVGAAQMQSELATPSSSVKVALPTEKTRTLKAKLRIKHVLSPDCFLNRSFRRYIVRHRMKGEESF